MKTGFEKFLECLDLYLELLNNPTIDEARIRIYGSVTLSNGAIVRATSNFHNREWFSEVAVSMSSEESVICLKLFTNMLLTNVHSFFTDFIVGENTNRASVEPRTDPVV